MCDYSSLSDQGLVELRDQISSVDSPIDRELSRRATALCNIFDLSNTGRCRLENWSLQVSRHPRDAGAIVLTGLAYGHPDFPNGTSVVTSPLQIIVRTADADMAITQNTVYQLSAMHPDTVAALLDENEPASEG